MIHLVPLLSRPVLPQTGPAQPPPFPVNPPQSPPPTSFSSSSSVSSASRRELFSAGTQPTVGRGKEAALQMEITLSAAAVLKNNNKQTSSQVFFRSTVSLFQSDLCLSFLLRFLHHLPITENMYKRKKTTTYSESTQFGETQAKHRVP